MAELLVGFELVSERRKLRGVSSEMLLHRIAAGTDMSVIAADEEPPYRQLGTA